jgi:hypothetical protein
MRRYLYRKSRPYIRVMYVTSTKKKSSTGNNPPHPGVGARYPRPPPAQHYSSSAPPPLPAAPTASEYRLPNNTEKNAKE